MKKLYIPLLFLLSAYYGALAQNVTVLGNAYSNAGQGCNCYVITPNAGNQHGAFYQTHTINLNNSFDFIFSAYWGCGTSCGEDADGMLFSLTANPGSLGGAGQTLGWGSGYGSQPCSVGVEFDTYSNGGSCSSGGECDPNYNELAIMANGDVCHCDGGNTLTSAPYSPYVPIQASGANVNDCNWHTVEIKWVVNTGTLSVSFDGNLRSMVTDLNMINDWFCGNPTVYWGWSGSTGGGCELQQVCIKSTSSWVAGTNYESCVPTIQFTDVSTVNASNVASWQWQFGDGTTSTLQNPLHTYPGPGTYNAELIITDVDGCADTFAHAVVIAVPISLTNTDVNPLCNGAQTGSIAVVAANGFGASDGLGGYKYNWSTGAIDSNQIGLGAGTYVVTCTDGICTTTASYTLTQPTAITAVTTSSASACGGATGSIGITITGGTPGNPPYSNFEWLAPGYTTFDVNGTVPAGTYVASFTDANGCSAALEYKATVASLPCNTSLTQSSTSATCWGYSNGTITVTLSGSAVVAPVTYTWSPPEANSGSLSNLAAGTYQYTITDAAANPPFTILDSVTVSQPAHFVASLSVLPSSCGSTPTGSAVASVDSGGVSPFTYAWSGVHPATSSLNGLSPGVISVTITDATGCTATATGTIAGPPPLTTSVAPVNDSCFIGQGPLGSATANPAGGTPPYSYLWSDSAVAKTVVGLLAGTYTVTITDAGGCTVTGNATISALSTTQVSHTISQQNIACFGNSTGSITVNPSGGTTPYTYTWSPNTVAGANPTGLAPGLYAVTISDAYGCQNTDTALLTQPASALAVVTSTQNVTCNGGSNGYIAFAITGGTSPYSLSYLGQVVPIPAVDTIKNLIAGTYNAIVIDSNLCQFPVSVTITQPGAPSITFSNVTNETCFGQTIGTATATFVNGTGNDTWIWSDSANTATASALAAGTFTVTGTDANGCTATNSVTITQPAAVPLPVTVNSNATCYGGNGSVTASYSGGTTPYTYTWSAPIVGTTATVTPPAGNNYTVTGTDANQCEETATFSITQPTHIDIGITQVNVLCNGNSTGSITLTVTGGTGVTYTYAWNPVSAGTTANPTGLTAGTYSVTVTDAANCTVDTSTIITQPAQALTVVEDSVNISCFGQSTGSITLIVTGGTPQYTYAWNPAVATDSTPAGLAAGPYAYTVTDANACSVTGSVNLTQPATALTDTATGVNVLCFDSSTGSVTAIPTGGTPGYTYNWSNNLGNTATVSNIMAGSYSVTVTDNNGCTASAPVVITQPQIGLSETEVQANEHCFGDAIGSITITVSGGTGAYTYNWNPNVSTTDAATGLAAGAYATTVTDANGCTLGDVYTVTQPGSLVVTAIGMNDSCFGQANGSIITTVSSGTAPYTYSWNPASAGTTANPIGLSAGTYSVTVTDADNCTVDTSVIITQPPLLAADSTPANPTCYGYSNGSLTVVGVGGTPNYTYSFSNGSTNSTGMIFSLAQGTYTFTVTDANNCTYSSSVTLVQPDSFIVSISPAIAQVNLGDTLQLQTSTNQAGSLNYIWYPNSGLSCYDCPNPVFNGVYSLSYQVFVSNQDSCTATAQFTVTVVPNYNIYIPNAFSPVGNGANDFWQLFGDLSSIKQVYVMVFDRIGEKVFESNDANFKWDGTYKGQPAPEGVYVYSIKFVWLDNHSDDTRKGSITLLR